jgi:hypothetical protein
MRRGPGQNQQDLQKYADEANAAADKTVLTKDQFQTEMQSQLAQMRARFQSQGGQTSSAGPRLGSGSRMGFGRGGSGATLSDRLATATTFLKYTDPSGQEVLLALDANGKVVSKWPRNFGGRSGPGGQPPAGNNAPQNGQQ